MICGAVIGKPKKREINDDIRTYIKYELDRILPKSYKRFSHICDFLMINFSFNFKLLNSCNNNLLKIVRIISSQTLGKNVLIKMYVC